MLSARAWKHHGHSFVCPSCRQKLPSATTLSHTRRSFSWNKAPTHAKVHRLAKYLAAVPQPLASRSLSTSIPLHNSDNTNGPTRAGAFPGGFANSAGSSWGSFASQAKRSTDTSSSAAADGLLPHEREARSKTNTTSPSPQAASPEHPRPNAAHNSNKKPRAGHGRGDRTRHRPSDAQVNKSKSVLADVFKANHEPQSPPTPESWYNGTQQQESATKDTKDEAQKPAGPSPGRASPGWDKFHRRRDPSPGKPSSASSHKTGSWGAFSGRKVQTTGHGHESTVWSEITRPRRQHTPHHAHGKNAAQNRLPPAKDEKKVGGTIEQDFWGELEDRVTNFRGKKNRRAGSADGPVNSRFKGAPSVSGRYRPQDVTEQSLEENLSSDAAPTEDQTESPKEPRRSRFEIDAEPAKDRRPKKSQGARKGRRSQREEDEDWRDEGADWWEKKQQKKAQKEVLRRQEADKANQPVSIFLPEYINIFNLARALKQQPETFLADMEEMGFENITNDTIMTGDTAALVAQEYGFEPTVDTGSVRDIQSRPPAADPSTLPSRPPVVTIMGHVDHGKTTLLDWLRKSSVAAQEHGGITQHIGAFVVKMSSGNLITFLDTPGHAAFLSMRQRGANVTDIVVLVVAADDSVMPQTIEALKHATAAKVPIIVAINKIDKDDARVDQVKADLSRHGVEIEDYGGDVQVVCVSGRTGQGMEDLEENISTLSEILDVRAEEDGMAEGFILESSIKANGKAATVLVKRGTMRPGDFIVAGKTWARIRVLRNEAGVSLTEAKPGTPVEILGWRDLPAAGQQVLQADDETKAKTAVEYRQEMADREESSAQLAEQEQRQRQKAAAEEAAAAEGDEAESQQTAAEAGIVYQNFTVRADVAGSVEAVCGSILELGNHEVRPRILRSAAGQISEYDVDHAQTSCSIIVNFNSTIPPHIKHRAEAAGVRILDHSVIYHTVDAVTQQLAELLPESVSFRVNGEADVVQIFPINMKRRVVKNIAGCKVRNGSIKRTSLVKVLRKGKVVFDGKIDTLKHVKKDVMEMGKGTECGIGLEGFDDLQPDDQIQTYEEVRERRQL